MTYTASGKTRVLTRRDQAERYRRSIRTIKRWGQNPAMNMPPEYDFAGLPSRREDHLEEWEQVRVNDA